jgi:hypothetical protein
MAPSRDLTLCSRLSPLAPSMGRPSSGYAVGPTLQSLLPPIGILGLNSKVFRRGWEARPRLGLAPSRRCLRAGRIRKAHLQVVLLMKTSPLDVSLMFAVACAIFGAFSEMAAPQLCSLSALTKDCSYGPAGSRREFQRGLLCHNPSRYGTHSLSPAPLSHSPQ